MFFDLPHAAATQKKMAAACCTRGAKARRKRGAWCQVRLQPTRILRACTINSVIQPSHSSSHAQCPTLGANKPRLFFCFPTFTAVNWRGLNMSIKCLIYVLFCWRYIVGYILERIPSEYRVRRYVYVS